MNHVTLNDSISPNRITLADGSAWQYDASGRLRLVAAPASMATDLDYLALVARRTIDQIRRCTTRLEQHMLVEREIAAD